VLRSAPNGQPLARLGTWTEFRSPRVLAAVSERRGWLEVIASELSNGRRGWIPASAATLASDRWKIEASVSRRRVTVFRGGRVVRRFTVAVGSPITPTPTGRFAVTDKIHMLDASPYGCCVLALSGHQPNVGQGWTGGDRLAIHATTMPTTIGEAASRGCLRASDPDARWLIDKVDLGTIVQIDP
jgi:lipoprotein-anchoring transpeptidase ErfK/SrfK